MYFTTMYWMFSVFDGTEKKKNELWHADIIGISNTVEKAVITTFEVNLHGSWNVAPKIRIKLRKEFSNWYSFTRN